MKAIGYVVTFLAVILFGVIFSGYALSILWGWFFVPILGLPELNIPSAIGITLVVQYLTHQHQDKDENKTPKEILITASAWAISKPCFAIFVGWIVAMWV